MNKFRTITILIAVIVIIGELYRSWGVGRPIMFVLDDVLMGTYLIISSLIFTKDTPTRRAFFASGWGMGAGLGYVSFFSKVENPEKTNFGNFEPSTLTSLVGIAFAVSIIGLATAILLPYKVQK